MPDRAQVNDGSVWWAVFRDGELDFERLIVAQVPRRGAQALEMGFLGFAWWRVFHVSI